MIAGEGVPLQEAEFVRPHEVAEYFIEMEDELDTHIEMAPYWDEDLQQLNYHFDLFVEEAAEQPDYSFSVPIPEQSWVHPENEDYRLEPAPVDRSRRQFLKGAALAGLFAAGTVVGQRMYEQETRSPYKQAVTDARNLVNNVRTARRKGTDRAFIYLGNVNEFTYWGIKQTDNGLGPVKEHDMLRGLLEDREVTVELVYLEEELETTEFFQRLISDQFNFLENVERFYEGVDIQDRALSYEASPLHANPQDADDVSSYYRQLWHEINHALSQGEAAFEHRVSTFPNKYFEEAGDRLIEELSRIGRDDISLEYRIRREPLKPFESLSQRRFQLMEDYRDDRNTYPVFITARDMGYAADGYGTPHHAMVRLPVALLLKEGETIMDNVMGRSFQDVLMMEVGHGVYRLPHTAARRDTMSYNKEYRFSTWLEDEPIVYGEMTKALAQRLVNADLDRGDKQWWVHPEDVSPDWAAALYGHNLTTFFSDVMHFPVHDWDTDFDAANQTATLRKPTEDGTVTVDASINGYIDSIEMRTE